MTFIVEGKIKNIKYTVLALILLFETSIIAQVVINEVQYDPPGIDTSNEWLEVKNIGPVQ